MHNLTAFWLGALAAFAGVGCASPSITPILTFDGGQDVFSTVPCQGTAQPIPERPLTLSSNDVAVRLAEFLWRKPADAALLQRATTVRTSRDVAALALEMETDPRFNAVLNAFTNSWLELDNLPHAMPADFVGFDAALAADMNESALRFVRAAFADPNGTLSTLLTSSTVFFNERLAPLYGMSFDASAGEWQQGEAPGGQRAGVSTLLARLTVSPRVSQRGLWFGTRLLCQAKLAPVETPEHMDGGAGDGFAASADASYRENLEKATKTECGICHPRIDGLGFAFQHFDEAGRFRQDDHGFPLDTKASDTLLSGAVLSFDGAADLGKVASETCELELCFVEAWLGRAFGTGDGSFMEVDTTSQVLGAFRAGGKNLAALLANITETPAFLAP